MDRGRPRKRVDPPPNNSPVWQVQDINEPGNIDRKAFEELPLGVTIADAAKGLGPNDAAVLRKQAVRQAEKFEILTLKDVETLSKVGLQSVRRWIHLLTVHLGAPPAGRQNHVSAPHLHVAPGRSPQSSLAYLPIPARHPWG